MLGNFFNFPPSFLTEEWTKEWVRCIGIHHRHSIRKPHRIRVCGRAILKSAAANSKPPAPPAPLTSLRGRLHPHRLKFFYCVPNPREGERGVEWLKMFLGPLSPPLRLPYPRHRWRQNRRVRSFLGISWNGNRTWKGRQPCLACLVIHLAELPQVAATSTWGAVLAANALLRVCSHRRHLPP